MYGEDIVLQPDVARVFVTDDGVSEGLEVVVLAELADLAGVVQVRDHPVLGVREHLVVDPCHLLRGVDHADLELAALFGKPHPDVQLIGVFLLREEIVRLLDHDLDGRWHLACRERLGLPLDEVPSELPGQLVDHLIGAEVQVDDDDAPPDEFVVDLTAKVLI